MAQSSALARGKGHGRYGSAGWCAGSITRHGQCGEASGPTGTPGATTEGLALARTSAIGCAVAPRGTRRAARLAAGAASAGDARGPATGAAPRAGHRCRRRRRRRRTARCRNDRVPARTNRESPGLRRTARQAASASARRARKPLQSVQKRQCWSYNTTLSPGLRYGGSDMRAPLPGFVRKPGTVTAGREDD